MLQRTKFSNGVHSISNEDYHSSNGISRSGLMEFKRSPYHYWYKYLSGECPPTQPTPNMALGSLVHTLALEPEKLCLDYFVTHQKARPKTGTGAHDKMLEEAAGRTILVQSELDAGQEIATALQKHEMVQSLLANVQYEQSIYFTHEPTGLQCKVRPDMWLNRGVYDLKTTTDGTYRSFQTSAYKYGYYLQAAMMHEALRSIDIKLEKFIFIAIETTAPYAIAIYLLDDEALDFGLGQFNELMTAMATCTASYNWRSYGIQNLSIPGYAKYDTLLEVE